MFMFFFFFPLLFLVRVTMAVCQAGQTNLLYRGRKNSGCDASPFTNCGQLNMFLTSLLWFCLTPCLALSLAVSQLPDVTPSLLQDFELPTKSRYLFSQISGRRLQPIGASIGSHLWTAHTCRSNNDFAADLGTLLATSKNC